MKIGKIEISQNFILTAIAVVVIVAGGFLAFGGDKVDFSNVLNFGSGLSSEEIAKKSMDYLNNNVLKGQSTATMVSLGEESGLVKIRVKIGSNEFDTYATKDGNLLMPQAFNIGNAKASDNNTANTNTNNQPTAKKTEADIKKSDTPLLEAFVVSKCPYGLQMQRVLADVVKSAPSLATNIMVRYMGSINNGKITAMHGDAEAQENLRQICIRDEQRSKYWDYISCHIKKGDTDSCLSVAGVSKSKLDSCMADASKGIAYAQADFDLQNKFDVSGSPTLIMNQEQASEFDFGGRTADALKTVVCAGFNSKPGGCAAKLSTASAATGFSETYASANQGANNSAAGCAPAN